MFASLVPDPDDPACPAAFRTAVLRLLKDKLPDDLKRYSRGRKLFRDPDPYKPYKGIPDTARNRLLMFIARWSPEMIAFETGASDKQPKSAEMLDSRCLAKWETSDPENEQGKLILHIAGELVKLANNNRIPTVLDPFSGGGAIPLEVGRIGAQAIANDYNPVASLILRATCELPQKFGKPGTSRAASQLQEKAPVANVLVNDVEHWAKWILDRAQTRLGHLYPIGKGKKPVIGYLWARTVPCSNPVCRAEIPLLGTLFTCKKPEKQVALTMKVEKSGKKTVTFGIVKGEEIQETSGTMLGGGDSRCPFCKQITPVKDVRIAGQEGKMGEQMVAVIVDTTEGKDYRAVEASDLEAYVEAARTAKIVERPTEPIRPEVTASEKHVPNRGDITVHLYGMKTWGSLLNPRQLVAMQTFVSCLRDAIAELEKQKSAAEYRLAVIAYLGLWVSKIVSRFTTLGRWNPSGENVETPFDMAKLAMTWDFPEVNPFSQSSGGAVGQLDWLLRVVTHESPSLGSSYVPARVVCGDGAALPIASSVVDAVVTDPPYFDEIAYADLSDLFYVWLKRGIGDVFPDTFATPLTPKSEEATALKHRHGGDAEKAERHFSSKLAACFHDAKRVCNPDGVIAVMFAHQTTEAWTALINALFEAGLNVTATYPIDTERKNRTRGLDSSALESSITVVCRPRQVGAAASFREVRTQIERAVQESVHRFWDYGFRGADLIVACYGPAVGVFGKYERVEKGDGTPVDVPTLLGLVRESALKAIAGEFTGDTLSRLYFVWANLYGIGEQAWDDARLVVMIGASDEDAMEVAHRRGLFVVDGSTCRLALLKDRSGRRHLGDDNDSPLIDQLHHAMRLWKDEHRAGLVEYLREHELAEHVPFWKLAQALFEVLPHTEEDWKLVSALLGERETLRVETRKKVGTGPTEQGELFE